MKEDQDKIIVNFKLNESISFSFILYYKIIFNYILKMEKFRAYSDSHTGINLFVPAFVN